MYVFGVDEGIGVVMFLVYVGCMCMRVVIG